MFKESHLNIEMIIAVLLFPVVYSEKKPDFGNFTACLSTNQSLTMYCSYPSCESSFTPFNCDLYDVSDGNTMLMASSDRANVNSSVSYLNSTSGICQFSIKDHATIYKNKTKIYTCHLSRRTSKEKKTLTVKYTKKEQPKKCPSGGPFLHVSRLLWSIAFLFFQETYL